MYYYMAGASLRGTLLACQLLWTLEAPSQLAVTHVGKNPCMGESMVKIHMMKSGSALMELRMRGQLVKIAFHDMP
jgi:hypothetical protein